MADNIAVSAGSGTTLATNETSIDSTTVQIQRVTIGAAPTITTGAAAPTTTAVQIVAANSDRKGVTIKNFGTVTVYLGTSGVATATGFPLDPGESYTPVASIAAIYGRTASGTGDARYIEES